MTEHTAGETAAPIDGAVPIVKRLVVVSGGTSDPSSTRMLATRLAERAVALGASAGVSIETRVIELRPLASDIASSIVAGFPSPALAAALALVTQADGLIVATPVYKAGVSGLVKSFVDVLDNDSVIAVPTLLAATAGTSRHALVADDQLRSLFAYLRAATTPTSVFAAPDDWGTGSLAERIDRAAHELVAYLQAGLRERIRDTSWQRYQHTFGTAGAGADEDPAAGVSFDTDLMRLAAGGGEH